MSKIICDVCGTSYPETATQCPICGCVRSSDSVTVAGDPGDVVAQKPASYAYVKGGRFSKTNVKKRIAGKPLSNTEPQQKAQPAPAAVPSNQEITEVNDTQVSVAQEVTPQRSTTHSGSTQQGSATVRASEQGSLDRINRTRPAQEAPRTPTRRERANNKKKETGLVIAILVLLLAIIGVVIYIACSYLGLVGEKQDQKDPKPSGQVQEDDSGTTPTEEAEVAISNLKLAVKSVELKSLGATFLLDVKTEPAGHDFDVAFESDDPTIATVDSTGKVVAVGRGVATITVTSGNLTAKCVITCNFEMPEVNEPEPPQNDEPTYKKSDLTFKDFGFGMEATFPLNWGSVQLYTGKIPADLVTFTSNDASVITVSDEGVITFVGTGRAIITAKYKDWTISFTAFVTNS